MTDLSSLSDAELLELLGQHAATTAPVANAGRDDAGKEEHEEFWDTNDVAKSTGIGLVKGTIGLAGMGGDVRELNGMLFDKAGEYLGLSPGVRNAVRTGAHYLSYLTPVLAAPSSATIRNAVEGVKGPFYEPTSKAGHFAETFGEFLPAALGGPETILPRLLTRAALPAAASELAGHYTQGTAAEPYARAAGGLVGGGVGAGAERIMAARQAALPTFAEVRKAAAAGHANPILREVELKPSPINTLAEEITNDLTGSKRGDGAAGWTHEVVNTLKNPVNGPTHTLEDLALTRDRLAEIADSAHHPVPEAKAAAQAKDLIEKYIDNLPDAHVAAGDHTSAIKMLREADANAAAAATAERIYAKLSDPALQARSALGGGVTPETQSVVRSLLARENRYQPLTPAQLRQIEEGVVRPGLGNTLTKVGTVLSGSGMAPAGAGFAVRTFGDFRGQAYRDNIVRQILARSPAGIAKAKQPPPRVPFNFWDLVPVSPATMPLRERIGDAQE